MIFCKENERFQGKFGLELCGFKKGFERRKRRRREVFWRKKMQRRRAGVEINPFKA